MRHWLLSKVNGHDNLEIKAFSEPKGDHVTGILDWYKCTTRYEDQKSGQEVNKSLLVNIPAMTENHRVCDIGKSLKCSLKNSNSSRN